MMLWLLEDDIFDRTKEFADTVRQLGGSVAISEITPAADPKTHSFFNPETAQPVIFRGSLRVGRIIRHRTALEPGAVYTSRNYFCHEYYPVLGPWLLNSNYCMLPFGDLNRCQSYLLQSLGQFGQVFVRPDSGNKVFAGQLISWKTWKQDLEHLALCGIDDAELIVVAVPRQILSEYRFVVSGRRILAGSQYMADDQVQIEPITDSLLAWRFAEKILGETEWRPDQLFTLDICKTQSGRYHILEIGSFSCSELYACDFVPIINEAHRLFGTFKKSSA